MRFAFLIMGNFDSISDRASIHNGEASIIGVSSIAEACDIASSLASDGIGCIELCGAFSQEGARKVIAATGGRVPVGYVTHLPDQDELYRKTFGQS